MVDIMPGAMYLMNEWDTAFAFKKLGLVKEMTSTQESLICSERGTNQNATGVHTTVGEKHF